ncbi:MAG: hypothetical protein ABIR54_05305 [Burkholderiaceae bacterium]|jgi:hypothetical protein
MIRADPGADAARQHLPVSRAVANAAAALACVRAAESSAVLINRLLTDGATMAAAWAVARLAVWMAQALQRAVRAVRAVGAA